jgi:hypothetical protein
MVSIQLGVAFSRQVTVSPLTQKGGFLSHDHGNQADNAGKNFDDPLKMHIL